MEERYYAKYQLTTVLKITNILSVKTYTNFENHATNDKIK